MADPISITVSVLALAVSSVTAWLTLFRRGTVKMTQPTSIFFGPDSPHASDGVALPKVYRPGCGSGTGAELDRRTGACGPPQCAGKGQATRAAILSKVNDADLRALAIWSLDGSGRREAWNLKCHRLPSCPSRRHLSLGRLRIYNAGILRWTKVAL
jgi:hypothetical protein